MCTWALASVNSFVLLRSIAFIFVIMSSFWDESSLQLAKRRERDRGRERGREGGKEDERERGLVNWNRVSRLAKRGLLVKVHCFWPDPSGACLIFHFQYDSPPHSSTLVHLYDSSCCMTLCSELLGEAVRSWEPELGLKESFNGQTLTTLPALKLSCVYHIALFKGVGQCPEVTQGCQIGWAKSLWISLKKFMFWNIKFMHPTSVIFQYNYF